MRSCSTLSHSPVPSGLPSSRFQISIAFSAFVAMLCLLPKNCSGGRYVLHGLPGGNSCTGPPQIRENPFGSPRRVDLVSDGRGARVTETRPEPGSRPCVLVLQSCSSSSPSCC